MYAPMYRAGQGPERARESRLGVLYSEKGRVVVLTSSPHQLLRQLPPTAERKGIPTALRRDIEPSLGHFGGFLLLAALSSSSRFHWLTMEGCTSKRAASAEVVSPPFSAAKATLALNSLLYCRRFLLVTWTSWSVCSGLSAWSGFRGPLQLAKPGRRLRLHALRLGGFECFFQQARHQVPAAATLLHQHRQNRPAVKHNPDHQVFCSAHQGAGLAAGYRHALRHY